MAKKIHLTRDDIKYSGNPIGDIVPEFIGQYCITTDNKIFFANGLTSQDWIEASGDIDISNLALKTEVNELNERLATHTHNYETPESVQTKVNTALNSAKEYTDEQISQIGSSGGASINDNATSTSSTWSSSKINSELNNKAEIMDGNTSNQHTWSGEYINETLSYEIGNHTHALNDMSGMLSTSKIATATTSSEGVVTLTNSVSSTSSGYAASATAVKTAYDRANSAYNLANHSHPYASSSHTHSGYADSSHQHYGGHLEPANVIPATSNSYYCGNHNSKWWYLVATNWIRYNGVAGGVYSLRSTYAHAIKDFFRNFSTITTNCGTDAMSTFNSDVDEIYNQIYEMNEDGVVFTEGATLASYQSQCLEILVNENEELKIKLEELEEKINKLIQA